MKNKYLIYILLLSLITRFIFCFIYGDQNLDHEWGILVNNFFEYKTFGFFVIEGQVTPNLYMPPLYAFFLIFLKFIINELKVLLILVFLIQSIISTISFYYLFKLTSKFYNYKISILITLLYSLFPLNFYAVSQISSIIFQSSFFIIFLYYIISFLIDKKLYYLFLASVFSGLLLLLRGEFLAIYFIFIFLVFTKKKIHFFLIYLIIPLLIISPYLIRNFNNFNTLTITKSFGYNLWKGNNSLSKVEGNPGIFSPKIRSELDNIKDIKKYDLIRDELFKEYAIKNILENKSRYFFLYLKKIISYITLDLNSSYPNYYNLLHIIPKFLIFLTTILGIIYYDKKNNYLNLILFLFIFNILLFSAFFILPRYNLMILPLQLIISGAFFDNLFKRKKI